MPSASDFTHLFVPGNNEVAPLLALHGTGGDERNLLPLARMISPHSAVLSPRGRVLENGMPRFFRRLAEGVFDLEDLERRTRELDGFVDEAAEKYGFERGRLVALGYSNGANIAASLLLTRDHPLGGAILLRPMVPFEPPAVPDLAGTPVLLSGGAEDPIVPQASTERLATLLRQAGAEVTLTWVPTGHGLVQSEITDAAEWFARHGGAR
jgi:phospholipase/carboxylesterase